MESQEFALRLAKLRAKKGVSARDMSLSIGQNPGYINNIETGRAMPSLPGLMYICEYLGISVREFFDTENENPGKIGVIIENLKKLDEAQLDTIASLVQNLADKK